MVSFAFITSIIVGDAKYYGKPLEVRATFEVLKDKQTNEEMVQSQTSISSMLKKRPRPFLNANGKIEFHSTSSTTTTRKPYRASTM